MILREETKTPESCGAVKEGSVQEGLYYRCKCLLVHPRMVLSPCQLLKGHMGVHKSVASYPSPDGGIERWFVDWPLDQRLDIMLPVG